MSLSGAQSLISEVGPEPAQIGLQGPTGPRIRQRCLRSDLSLLACGRWDLPLAPPQGKGSAACPDRLLSDLSEPRGSSAVHENGNTNRTGLGGFPGTIAQGLIQLSVQKVIPTHRHPLPPDLRGERQLPSPRRPPRPGRARPGKRSWLW